MSILVIDDAAMAAIAKVLAYAEENHFTEAKLRDGLYPGDDPNLVLLLGSYRVVFSITELRSGASSNFEQTPNDAPDGDYRHLSISVATRGKLPHPYAAFMIADAYGFTGWDAQRINAKPDWIVQSGEFVTIMQKRTG